MDEKQLISLAKKGDEAAFERLVLQNQNLIWSLALRSTGDPSEAEELTQEVFVKAWLNLRLFRGDSRFSSWLYRICQNLLADRARRRAVRKEIPLFAEDGESELPLPDPGETPAEAAERAEARALLQSALACLPPDQRDTVVLRDIEGLSYAEIAGVFSVSEGTVKSRLSRAREKLRTILSSGNYFSHYASKLPKGDRYE